MTAGFLLTHMPLLAIKKAFSATHTTNKKNKTVHEMQDKALTFLPPPLQVPLDITQAGSIITWDFDVLGGCFYFEILFVQIDESKRSSCLNVVHEYHENLRKRNIEQMDGRGDALQKKGEIESVTVLDQLCEKTTGSVDTLIVQERTFCQPGDSVQVSASGR